jgi:RNA polymerase sigma-70 factor (ECF subfamily)
MEADNFDYGGPFNEAAFGALRGALVRRARSMVSNDADAEDVVQTALERAWRERGRFRAGSSVTPWLMKITTHAAIDHLRKLRPSEELLANIPRASEGTETVVARAETIEELASAVRDLSAPYRDTWLLHDVHGLSAHEISAGQALPYHTVRTHLQRARKRLRRALSEATS